jgi:hypothetical protein
MIHSEPIVVLCRQDDVLDTGRGGKIGPGVGVELDGIDSSRSSFVVVVV